MRGEVIKRAQWQGGIDYRGANERTTSAARPDDRIARGHVREAVNVTCDANGTLRRRSGFVADGQGRNRSYVSGRYLAGRKTALMIASTGHVYPITAAGGS